MSRLSCSPTIVAAALAAVVGSSSTAPAVGAEPGASQDVLTATRNHLVTAVSLGADATQPAHPVAGPTRAPGGAYLGTSAMGGEHQFGSVFRIAGSELQVLHSFAGHAAGDGERPLAAPLRAADASLYGVTLLGGTANRGVAYSLSPSGVYRVLHSFSGGPADGSLPSGPLSQGADGQFYGLTQRGGEHDAGVLYRMTADGELHVVHSFGATGDVSTPAGPLLLEDGVLYGTAAEGGAHRGGGVFRIDAEGGERVLALLGENPQDGRLPTFGVTRGGDAALYLPTPLGGSHASGSVVRVAEDGTHRVVHSFGARGDGSMPSGPLLRGRDGTLRGLTVQGGECNKGTAYRLGGLGGLGGSDPARVTHSFCGGEGGATNPQGTLLELDREPLEGTGHGTRIGAVHWIGLSSTGGAHGAGALFGMQ